MYSDYRGTNGEPLHFVRVLPAFLLFTVQTISALLGFSLMVFLFLAASITSNASDNWCRSINQLELTNGSNLFQVSEKVDYAR
jgi:hypothetical protein